MKKTITAILFITFIMSAIMGQTIPNGGMENWQNRFYYDYPIGWFSAVEEGGDLLVKKSTDAKEGDFSLRLETNEVNDDVNFGYAVYGIPGDNGFQGMPFSNLTDTVRFWLKGDIKAGDHALVLGYFFANGVPIDTIEYLITGTYNNWTKFSIGYNQSNLTPDSLFFGFVSSNPFTGNGVKGTWIMVDDVYFTKGTSTTRMYIPNFNSGFELWENASGLEIDNWESSNKSQILTLNDSFNVTRTSDANSGNYAAKMKVIEVQGFTIKPDLNYYENNFNSQPNSFKFWYKYFPVGGDEAEINLEFYNDDNYVGGTNQKITSGSSSYQEFVTNNINYWGTPNRMRINISAGENVGTVLFVDDFTFGCTSPKYLFGKFDNASSATLSWSKGGDETKWIVNWGISGFNPNSGTLNVVNTNPTMQLTSISDNNSYEFYVRSVCGAGDSSEWEGPYRICKAVSAPISENFETTMQDYTPDCWNSYSSQWATAGVKNWPWASFQGNNMYLMNAGQNQEALLISPIIKNSLDSLYVSFYIKNPFVSNMGKIWVGTMSNPSNPNTFNPLESFAISGQYEMQTYFFDNYSGTDKFIAFYLEADNQWTEVYMDSITIDLLPSCIIPKGIQISNITTNGASLSWQAYTPNKWNVYYGLSGFDTATQGTKNYGITNLNLTLSGLSSGKKYDVYIESDCGSGNKSFAIKKSFVTSCSPFSIPFSENFEDIETGTIPYCWSKISKSYNNNLNIVDWYQSTSGMKSIMFYNGSENDTLYLITPEINQALKNLTISFNSKYDNNYSIPNLYLGTISNPNEIDSFNLIQQFNGLTDQYKNMEYTLDNYNGNHKYLCIMVTNPNNNQSTQMFIDDLEIKIVSGCKKPKDIQIVDISLNSAKINWTKGGSETEWNLFYVVKGDPYNTGTLVNNHNTNSYTMTNLQSFKMYDVFLQSVCGNNDTSDWIGPFNFITNLQCPSNSVYGQIMPFDNVRWSSINTSNKLIQSFDNLNSFYDELHVYTLLADNDAPNYTECYQNPIDIEVVFYQDNHGFVGHKVDSFLMTTQPDSTDFKLYNRELYEMILPFPRAINMSKGWFSIRSVSVGQCNTIFATTNHVNAKGVLRSVNYLNIGDTQTYNAPLSYCLTNNSHSINYTAGNGGTIDGQIQVNQIVRKGNNASTVKAIANDCYEFVKWSDNSIQNPRTDLNISSNLDITAEFRKRELIYNSNHTICKGEIYSWRGKNYSVSGIYYDSLKTAQNCDSVFALNLNVEEIDINVVQIGAVLTAPESSSYQWLDCNDNKKIIPGAIQRVYTATKSGKYAVELVQNNCKDTSACLTVELINLSENYINLFKVYPNPNTGILNLELNQSGKVIIFNPLGTIVYENNMQAGSNQIPMNHFSDGMYILKVYLNNEIGGYMTKIILAK
jgi:hypothetical protein